VRLILKLDEHLDQGDHSTIRFTPSPEREGNSLKNLETTELSLLLEGNCLACFSTLLQSGVSVKMRMGISLMTALRQEFGLDPKGIEKIETVFLDGKAVDDLESSMVRDGSVLALSAAMPGLVGATLRRGSYYAAMRSQITDRGSQEGAVSDDGLVTVKLFNLLMQELGPMFLRKGVWVKAGVLHGFLIGQSREFWINCKEARINGRRVETEELLEMNGSDPSELICLKVETSSGEMPKR